MSYVKYDTVPNTSSGKNGLKLTDPKSFKEGIDPKSLYRDDTQTRDQFPEHLGTPNPAYNYLKQDSSRGEWGVHPQPFINKYKVCDVAVYKAGLHPRHISPSSQDFGNWRKNSAIKVDPNILLMTDAHTMSGGYSHEIGKAWDGMKPGFLNQVEGAIEMARLMSGSQEAAEGGKFVSKYREVPVWKGTTPAQFSDLKFHFEFGMAGIYSGEHEVVRPIFALASQFTPYFAYEDNYLKGPAPTDAVYFVEMASSMIDYVKSGGLKKDMDEVVAGANFSSASDTAGTLVKAATKIQNIIYNAIDQGIQKGANHGLMSIHVRYGRFVTGPYFVKNINWDLDFSEVDEYGFPFKGTLSLGGLQSLWVTTSGDFINSFNAET